MAKVTKQQMQKTNPGLGIYFVTYVGAAIYFVDKADGFGQTVLAFLQAAVWPAYLVNHVFTMLRI
ncbi:MAG: hypothetical protein JWN82_612 [Candidatus Saccharibacteria bacterium]|nr:hypothetical protein [Candidatus Saccharibacteria bacterium]